ncbi:hypothetical protein CAPTEDRAFT_131723, partial [Capitella teleta]
EGYKQLTVNHSANFKDPKTGAHTNSIEGTWQKIKHGTHFPKFRVKTGFFGWLFGRISLALFCKGPGTISEIFTMYQGCLMG